MTQDRKEYMKAWKEAHKDYVKAKNKAWRESHKDYLKAKLKEWKESHKEHKKIYEKAWYESHKEEINEYSKTYKLTDLNSLGELKHSIRSKSRYYISKYGKKISGYQIHHCCTYTEPYKFIYCSREMHRLIHAYLRQHNIDADSDHYQYIKHLLDDTVIKYNVE